MHQLPSFYAFNANSIAKPPAKEQLHGDLLYYNIDIAVISESKLKKHHMDEFLALPNYHLYRRDRLGRGGSGIAIYAKDTYNCTECVVSSDSRDYELLWLRIQDPKTGESMLVGGTISSPKAYLPSGRNLRSY